jgi:hypothetical protein
MLESYAITLYAFVLAMEVDRIDSIISYGHRIDLAGMMAYAFHEPKRLKVVDLKYQSLLLGERVKDEAIERAKRMHAELMGTPGFATEE